MSIRAGQSILAIIILGTVIWLYTPLPTSLAHYVWDKWHAGGLAVVFDRDDAVLAFTIGAYYFGNQFSTSTAEKRPYNLPLAQRAFGKAIQISPSLPLAHYMRARIEFIQSDFTSSLEDLNTELALSPGNKRTLYMRGLTYAYRGVPGDLTLAERDFKDFVTWAPREWAGYNDLAFILAKEKHYGNAITVLKEGIAKADSGDKNPWLFDALGVMELNLGDPYDAVEALAKAQTFASSLTDADWQRAYPGNNPVKARDGISAMQAGIAENLVTAYATTNK